MLLGELDDRNTCRKVNSRFGDEDEGYDVPICIKIDSVEVISSIYSPISIDISWR